MATDRRRLKLTILGQEQIASWTKGGKEVTLYAVQAKDWTGDPLRTFQTLPVGEGEFDASPYRHPEHGDTLTLKLPGSGVGSALKELRTAVEGLTARVAALEARLGPPETDVHPGQDPDAPRGPSMLPPPDDEDAPF